MLLLGMVLTVSVRLDLWLLELIAFVMVSWLMVHVMYATIDLTQSGSMVSVSANKDIILFLDSVFLLTTILITVQCLAVNLEPWQ